MRLDRIRHALPFLAALFTSVASADPIDVAGRVLTADDAPLAEARVTLVPYEDSLLALRRETSGRDAAPTVQTLTDPAGRYRLEAPHAGMWTVRVEAPGFAPLEAALRPLVDPQVLEDARLSPDAGLVVAVLDPAGKPVPAASVAVAPDRGTARFGRPTWEPPPRRALTGDDGKTSFPLAERAAVRISVLAAGFPLREVPGHRGTAARIQLRRGSVRALEIVSRDGRPVPGAFAAVGKEPHRVGVTDASGRLALNLEPGSSFEIRALHDEGRRVDTRIGPPDPDESIPLQLVLPERRSLVGRVIDAESRRAVTGGVIWDQRDPQQAALTDSAGGFVYVGPLGARLELTAAAPGYLKAEPFDIQLEDDGRPGPTLPLRPAAAISGTVVDPAGQPVALAELELAPRRGPSRMRIEIGRTGQAPRTQSGARGEFRIGPVDPERGYELHVQADDFAPATVPVAGLEPYKTLSGVRVTLSRGRTITGIVVDEQEQALRGATVELAPQPDESAAAVWRVMGADETHTTFEAESDGLGRFELRGLPAGRFDLSASRTGYARRRLPGIVVADEGPPTDVGRIVLGPGQTVQGTVRDDDGRPIEDAEVFVREAAGGMVMVVGGPGAEAGEPQARTDPSGWFAVGELERGARYDVEARRRGYVNARASGVELPRVDPLEIAMQPASRVAGRVSDVGGEPIAGARVVLRRSRTLEMGGRAMAMLMMEDATTDQEGRFVFEDEEPGTVSLSAVASGYQEARRDNLQVPKGEHLEGVEIPLPAGAILEGRVLGADGRPAIGASVGLVGEQEGLGGMVRDLQRVGVDGNGYYRIEGLEPGALSVEAVHPEHPRVVRDTEVREGRNSLDLSFTGGQAVSGRVTDAEGNPIAEAAVRLVPTGRAWGGPEATTAGDGTFTLPGVRDGDYNAWADAAGFASFDGRLAVHVEGQPVAGLELRLDRGAAILGRVGGIEPERYAAATVEAEGQGPGAFGSSRVDHSGEYRIEHLSPGPYSVKARLQDSGRQAVGQIVVEPGAQETRLDLEFGAGLSLSGTVLQADEPLAGVTVYAEGVDVDAEGYSETDLSGKFSIEGLDAGSFRVHVRDFRTGLAYSESVELATSRDVRLVLPTATVSGRVRDSADRQALSGVTLALSAAAVEGAPLLAPHTTTTDLEGRFALSGVADGSWRLTATRKGYAARAVPVELQLGRSVDDLAIELEPTEGLTLEARMPGGAAPETLLLAVLDRAGGSLVGGSYATGEGGRVRLSSVPAGDWELVVSAPGAATAALPVRAPGPPVAVELPPATRLRIEVPELVGTATLAAVRIQNAEGHAFRALGWSAQPRGEWTLEGGTLELAALPPGSWTVSVACADGRSWSGHADTSPAATAVVRME